jgi:hypothetical protein
LRRCDRSHRSGRPDGARVAVEASSSAGQTLSVLVPVYNERATIESVPSPMTAKSGVILPLTMM